MDSLLTFRELIERPVREYEFVSDVTRSWDVESNALFFRRTTMWPILSSHVRLAAMTPLDLGELTNK